jgi:ABC-2 type transport system ATP-binding protein
MAAVDVHGVTKRYASIEALRGVDLTVPEGCVFGLLGPNGAGKSTLIKALVGSLRPTTGQVRTLGLDPLRDRAALRQQIGYMPQSPALYGDLSARDNVSFFAAAHGTPDLDRRVDEVLAFTELGARAREPVRQFSGGMQRRLSLACALAHRPRMLLLDEPTAAVDPALRARFWQSFRALAADGATLLISTHLMDEALLCDLVAVQREGQIIACAPPREILARGHTHVRLCDGGRERTFTIGSRPQDLALALHPYGLRPDVSVVAVEADSLEAVILRMIESQEGRRDA